MERAAASLLRDESLAELRPREGENDPYFLTGHGGSRLSLATIPHGMVESALRLMYFRGVEVTEGGLASLVIENYEELKRAVRGEAVRTYTVYGITGIELPKGMQIVTPWGIVSAAPEPNTGDDGNGPWPTSPKTTAVLVSQRLTKIDISREGSPEWSGDREEFYAAEQRIYECLPLAFALAAAEGTKCAPTVTFTTTVNPFIGQSGSSWGGPPLPFVQPLLVEPDQVQTIEDWARRLNTGHVDGLQVAAKRIVSAIAGRHDKADALIDAVTVWETLVGTRAETVFRVTAALTRLLETDPAERGAFRKRLADIYDTRSRVIHGELVDPETLSARADAAIDIALAALRAIYDRGQEWLTLKSTARADRLILGES